MIVLNLLDELDLKIFKCKNVKTPAKAWDAAGWDLFVPNDLTIFDFAKSYKNYLDESVSFSKNERYNIPIIFYLSSIDTIGEFICRLFLTWNKNINEWVFNIEYFDADGKRCNSLLIDLNDEIGKWIGEKTTYISHIELEPHAKINIPSGIHVNLPENVFLKIENKSGISSKRGLSFLASVIDVDYQGEIHINVVNTGNLPVMIHAGEKIVQALPLFQPQMKNVIEFSSLDELYENKNSNRGAGGFGSSGEK